MVLLALLCAPVLLIGGAGLLFVGLPLIQSILPIPNLLGS